MRWEQVQKPLREGMQVFRTAWPEDIYLLVEDHVLRLFSDAEPSGTPWNPGFDAIDADDWAATGPSGE